MCFDMSNEKTLDSVTNFWMQDLDKYASNEAVRFLVGCKADLAAKDPK